MTPTFSSHDVIWISSTLLILLILISYWLRAVVKRRQAGSLCVRAHKQFGVFTYRGPLLKLGVVMATSAALMALNWSKQEVKHTYRAYSADLPDEIEIIVPRTPPPAPLAPPPPPEDIPELVHFPSDRPRFPGCEDMETKKDKDSCADKKLLTFLYDNIIYPKAAKDNKIEGRTFVQFTVETDGRITDIESVRPLGGGCSEEAVRVVNLMNELPERWTPGKQGGRPVRVRYTLPVVFRLE